MKRLAISVFLLVVLFGCGSSESKGAAATKQVDGNAPPTGDNGSTPSAATTTQNEVVLENPGKGETITLRLNPAPSESWTYRTSVETIQSGAESHTINTEMEQAVAVKRVQGGAEISITITGATMKANDAATQDQVDEMARMMKGIQTVAVYDARGHTEGAKSSGGAGVPAMIAAAQAEVPVGLFGVVYPSEPVAVGAEWTGKYDMEKVLQGMARASGATARVLKGGSHPVRYRLEEVRTIRGRKVAVISFTLRGDTEVELTVRAMTPSGGTQSAKVLTKSSINGTGKAQVDIETGIPIRVEMEQRSTAEAQGSKTQTLMKSVMRRED